MARFIFAPALTLVAGCAVPISYVQLSAERLPARTAGAPVEVFVTHIPPCPYQELGLMTTKSAGLAPAIEPLRARAREAGADGVIITRSAKNTPLSGTRVERPAKSTLDGDLPEANDSRDLIEGVAVSLRCPPDLAPTKSQGI